MRRKKFRGLAGPRVYKGAIRGRQNGNPGFIAPRKWAEASYNITHWTEMPRGGHFAAMEQPELFVNDLRLFFDGLR